MQTVSIIVSKFCDILGVTRDTLVQLHRLQIINQMIPFYVLTPMKIIISKMHLFGPLVTFVKVAKIVKVVMSKSLGLHRS